MKIITQSFLLTAGILILTTTGISQTLVEKTFRAETEAEAVLDLTAIAPGTSWREAGSEAATVTIFVDGNYHQDLILHSGHIKFTYTVILGRVSAGEHKLRIELNRKLTAAGTVRIDDARISLVGRDDPRFAGIANAPILYARSNTIGRFSDIPLLMYYETIDGGGTLRYTVIFSNEDGGTQTSALMSRWGRTTDIEWVTETKLERKIGVPATIFQGVNHVTTIFSGRLEADHPLLRVASDNNNFSDVGVSGVRFTLQPIEVDLSRSSREDVMDRYPWTWQVMAEEMLREGKLTDERTLGKRIADLRNYLYLDAESEQRNGSAISFSVKLKNDPVWYNSDQGIGSYRIDRSGFYRTTIRLPRRIRPDEIERVAVACGLPNNPRTEEDNQKASEARCELKSVNKIFLLDDGFQPAAPLPIRVRPVTLPFGTTVVLEEEKRSDKPH
ncbi:MAG: hypothetical protein IPM66_05995 [Acidobacteriota bacterium]|nr:MAG: hypothetical protein IPM66_05995 [Acidobacteriota bacterium]